MKAKKCIAWFACSYYNSHIGFSAGLARMRILMTVVEAEAWGRRFPRKVLVM
jgi:hypothetical protein